MITKLSYRQSVQAQIILKGALHYLWQEKDIRYAINKAYYSASWGWKDTYINLPLCVWVEHNTGGCSVGSFIANRGIENIEWYTYSARLLTALVDYLENYLRASNVDTCLELIKLDWINKNE